MHKPIQSIRGGSGLGDSIYLQAVCRYLLSKGHALKIHTNYPDVFRNLRGEYEIAGFSKININILAHYSMRRKIKGFSQFEDCCIEAGLKEPVELKLDWQATSNTIKKPYAVVGLPRSPMARTDGMGAELLPCMKAYQRIIDKLKAQGYLIVQVGAGEPLHKLQNIDVDLANQTSVSELIDVVSLSDFVICYPSFLVPLAESLDKRYVTLFSHRGLVSPKIFLRQITPDKVMHCKDLGRFVVDEGDIDAVFG